MDRVRPSQRQLQRRTAVGRVEPQAPARDVCVRFRTQVALHVHRGIPRLGRPTAAREVQRVVGRRERRHAPFVNELDPRLVSPEHVASRNTGHVAFCLRRPRDAIDEAPLRRIEVKRDDAAALIVFIVTKPVQPDLTQRIGAAALKSQRHVLPLERNATIDRKQAVRVRGRAARLVVTDDEAHTVARMEDTLILLFTNLRARSLTRIVKNDRSVFDLEKSRER